MTIADGTLTNESLSNGTAVNGHATSGDVPHLPSTNGHVPERSNVNGSTPNGYGYNGTSTNGHTFNGEGLNGAPVEHHETSLANDDGPAFTPMAICGMACRLPGGIDCPQKFWDFLLAKGDARTRVPSSRFNASAFSSPDQKPGTIISEYGYFLDESVDLGALDTSFFPTPRADVERMDPQQRLLLEVTREALDDAGEVTHRGDNIGVYVGSYGQDWLDLVTRDPQRYGRYEVTTTADFMLSNRMSYELDFRGPSMTIRTGCSAALIGLNEACMAIARGDCKSAVVGGTNILISPAMFATLSEHGVLGKDGSCKTFSADADGYARGEAILAIYVKSLDDALRDGSPIRAVLRGSAANHNGKTHGVTSPSSDAQEALIKQAYKSAGISMEDISKTGLVECHGTGTTVGDPLETEAVARVIGNNGMYIGAVKPNMGHSEGASGLTSLIKAVLALEHRTIPPNIKCLPLNPDIPFDRAGLKVPTEPTPWPEDRLDRVGVNSFGVGGANCHVILDSAATYKASRALSSKKSAPDTPHLLVYSARSPESLKKMTEDYQTFLDETSEPLVDVAYTLANRREHLPYRSFAVATKDQPGQAAPPGKAGQTPSLVMVFTGQGAQWPQMGRDLLRSHPVFRNTIRSLDKCLETLRDSNSPTWKLEEELLKPARTSRVNEAEFSQPLCTALQLALVDTLHSIGIEPAAVVGHSSGEIAAAYAVGALTAEEAIAIAVHRGETTKRQNRPGAMAAVGLSWEEAEKHLVPGVCIACDNSPNSVTLSGDADKLESVVANIKASLPNVLATMLKVEKAYHSYHMAEVGEAYFQELKKAKVVGNHPVKPFFSSVTGELLTKTKEVKLGPRYWQKNLESPVLFNSAVSRIMDNPLIKNPVFLEVGPHSALAGPLRQIFKKKSSDAPYVNVITRKESSVLGFLSAVGKLFTLHAKIDFDALMPQGICVPDLPRYPWHHQQSYWFESRVTKEWRLREYPYHDLLGVKVPECTDLEPVWRNLLHLNNAPWIRDHKIKEDIIFPFAGYMAIAAEAVRQTTGIQESVSFRHVAVRTALVVPEGKPTELVTTMRRHRLTDFLDSEWWEFTITAHNGHSWTKHCSGEVRAESITAPDADATALQDLPRKVSSSKWYDTMCGGGIEYGYHFTSLNDITVATVEPRLAKANIRNNWHGDEANYHLHPVVLDSYLQLLGCASRHGLAFDYVQAVPTGLESLTIHRSASDDMVLSASARLRGKGFIGKGSCIADGKMVLQISGVEMSPLDKFDAESDSKTPITARCEWVKDIDFEDLNTLVHTPHDHTASALTLDRLAQIAITLSQRLVKDDATRLSHMEKYEAWLNQQKFSDLEIKDTASLTKEMDDLISSRAESPAGSAATAIAKVSANASALFSGSKTALGVLDVDDTLGKLHGFVKEYSMSDFIRSLGHSRPNLKVLELAAGAGSMTSGMLSDLTRPNGQVLYSRYVFSDKTSGIINSAKERFKDVANMDFAILDISKDPADQGLQDGNFDLIVASDVMNSTSNAHESLVHVHKLLAPDGRLVLQEPRPGLRWTKFVFGTFASWWNSADDGRPDEPYLSPKEWQDRLTVAGFGEIHISPSSPSDLNTVLVAKPQQTHTPSKRITILGTDTTSSPSPLESELQSHGYQLTRCTLSDTPPAGQDVLSLLDTTSPFFDSDSLTSSRFDLLKAFIDNLKNAGLFWLTYPSQLHSTDPRYAPVIGLARTMRSELELPFATCEVDSFTSPSTAAVAGAFEKFHVRREDASMGPDLEFAIVKGATYVNRVFPFELEKEMDVVDEADQVFLKIERPGRLDSLRWCAQPLEAPLGVEVEVEVHSVGLSFRDVLVMNGIIELAGKLQSTFGYEAAGIVRRIGPDVTKVAVGDRVMMTGANLLGNIVKESEELCAKIPQELEFADAASMPVVYATVIYSLIDIGHLEKGMSVLIHSGCGGVGLAAIQIAQMLGAEIYTTVSSEEKVNYLMNTFNIPRNRIFNSRSTSFVDDLMRETDGKGADVVLNALSGELLHASWRCVAKWGTMVEIGKRDLLGAGKLDMDHFLANRNYCCFDLGQVLEERKAVANRLLRATLDYFNQGYIKPIPLSKVFDAVAVADALKLMQQGNHIGKIVFELRDNAGEPHLEKLHTTRKQTLILDSSASYLLIGGLGGLGRSIAVWMVQRGARHLTFLSRSAGTGKHDRDFVREIESMGCSVQLVRGSVTNKEDVTRAVSGVSATLKGIIQMTMVLHDQSFPRMTFDDWESATQPKIQGTWNLHNSTQGMNLDFFCLFSSISGILGQPGQANYAGANTFLDAFVQYRASQGLPCTAIDIGAMEGAGYLAENKDLLKKMQGVGFSPVPEIELLQALEPALLPRAADQSIQVNKSSLIDRRNFLLGIVPSIPLSSSNSSARLRKDIRLAVYHNTGNAGSASNTSDKGFSSFLATAKQDPAIFKSPDTVVLIAKEIGKKLFGLLLKSDDDVDVSLSLTEVGFDSLIAIEMRAWWKQTFGFNLSMLEMLGMGTLESLGKRAVDGLIALSEA